MKTDSMHRFCIYLTPDQRQKMYDIFRKWHGMQTKCLEKVVDLVIELAGDDPNKFIAAILEDRLVLCIDSRKKPTLVLQDDIEE